MTEADLIEINGLVARVKRLQQKTPMQRSTADYEEITRLKSRLYRLSVTLNYNGWDSPPPDMIA